MYAGWLGAPTDIKQINDLEMDETWGLPFTTR